jgi:hypothetical protein
MTLDELYQWGDKVRERTQAAIDNCELAVSAARNFCSQNDLLRAESGLTPKGRTATAQGEKSALHICKE